MPARRRRCGKPRHCEARQQPRPSRRSDFGPGQPLDHASVIELDCLGGSVIQDASEFGKMFQGSGRRTLCVILDQLHHSKRPIEQPQCRVLYELS